jgi:hypothetical protein
MQSERALTRQEIEERAARVRKEWSPAERLSRLELPPDSVLWDSIGLRRPERQSNRRSEKRFDRSHRKSADVNPRRR